MMLRRSVLWLLILWPLLGSSADIQVAVAANFHGPMQRLAKAFEADHPHRLRISVGSTGTLYAQIINGAPFDVFLSADSDRPQRLERDRQAVAGTRMTYARGWLALWVADCQGAGLDRLDQLDGPLAMANPRLAPYGAAALSVLDRLGHPAGHDPALVYGQSLAQTYQFVASGNAPAGLVALSQVLDRPTECWVRVPEHLHAPLDQQAILLIDTPPARTFMAFLASEQARAIIEAAGYGRGAG